LPLFAEENIIEYGRIVEGGFANCVYEMWSVFSHCVILLRPKRAFLPPPCLTLICITQYFKGYEIPRERALSVTKEGFRIAMNIRFDKSVLFEKLELNVKY